jgi:heme exporter protein A
MLKLETKNLAKYFGSRKVFDNIDIELQTGQSLALVGRNGSGKTTLLKVIIGLIYPSKGEVIFSENGKNLEFDQYRKHLSLVAPYFSLYEALTSIENLRFFAKVSGISLQDTKLGALLNQVGLDGRGDDFVSSYSTGMKQRLKYAVAMLKRPEIFLIDEPGTNLDEAGKEIVANILDSVRKEAIIIIATNEPKEYELADGICQLDK